MLNGPDSSTMLIAGSVPAPREIDFSSFEVPQLKRTSDSATKQYCLSDDCGLIAKRSTFMFYHEQVIEVLTSITREVSNAGIVGKNEKSSD